MIYALYQYPLYRVSISKWDLAGVIYLSAFTARNHLVMSRVFLPVKTIMPR
jgi:hypothetical protein